MVKQLTEDQVRDKARKILDMENVIDVVSGVGQLTTFNQLGFKGVADKPDESSPNLCVNYFFSRALVVQGMPLHPCLCTSTLEGAVKGAPLRTSKRFP